MPNPSIYTNYLNVHLSIGKLDETNYDTRASDIKLWLKSQDYVDHLTQCVHIVVADDASRWLKIGAQLCIVIKSTITHFYYKYFVFLRCVHKFGNMRNYYTPMILNVFYGVSKSPYCCCSQTS